jgi:hypothetical protein
VNLNHGAKLADPANWRKLYETMHHPAPMSGAEMVPQLPQCDILPLVTGKLTRYGDR